MSFFSDDQNRPKTESADETFTTTPLNFFPGFDRGLVIIRIAIDNQDVTNELTFNKNGRGGLTFTVPPNSIGVIENEVLTGVRIIPDGTTGKGQISADLARRPELRSRGFLVD